MAKKPYRGPKQGGQKRGPPPEVLVIEGPWKVAVGKALAKGKPPKTSPKKKRRSK